jgi:hypothetical protein
MCAFEGLARRWITFLVLGLALVLPAARPGAAGTGKDLVHSIEPSNKNPSIASLLNPDGSLDPTGWRMVATSEGPPRFIPETAFLGDEKWDRRFFSPGTSGRVQAIATSGSDVYVGGEFIQVGGFNSLGTRDGGLTVNRIAKWDSQSQTWSALGVGMNNDVFAIAVMGPTVFVGGAFTQVDGQDIGYIAMWDGKSWSALGSGVDNNVQALAVSGSRVYVGGIFTSAGGLPGNHIAVWNTLTQSWSTLGAGVNGTVHAIAVSGNDIYVGGSFSQAGGGSAHNIARWGGGGWGPLGSGVNNRVNAIAVRENIVYAGGEFTQAGGASANYIARWDGNIWSEVGGGTTGNPFGWVLSIAASDSGVYASGIFTHAGGTAVSGIARWDGSQWNPLGSGVDVPEVWAIALDGTNVYAGGLFGRAGDGAVAFIACWDGTRWFGLGAGLSGNVQDIVVSGTDVYAGGNFTDAGGVMVNKIARWDGRDWHPLGSGVSGAGFVHAVAASGDIVYAGGDFTQIGGVAANRIARWDGGSWAALGSGVMNGSVNAIAVNGTDVYVGGSFTDAGGLAGADNIARWDGNNWAVLGSGLNGPVNAIAISGSNVYAGGSFDQAGGMSANRIARWNGSNWSPLGDGISSVAVHAITVLGNEIYAGGEFTQAGGVSASNIARWDGNAWAALGSGTNGRVLALASSDTDIYAGGLFSMAGGNASVFFGSYTKRNTPQMLSYPSPVTITPGGSRSINAATGPSDDVSVDSIVLHSVTLATFTGAISVNNTTGVVSISNAGPLGSFTVTIRATDNEGLFTDASFTLLVTNLGTCSPQTKIVASDGLTGDMFGSAVAMDGDTLVVGAPFDDNPASGAVNQGAAYVYVLQGDNWALQQKLIAGDGLANDYFGFSVAVSGDSLVVGTPGASGAEIPSAHPGKAYIFIRNGANWSQQAKLVASDGAVNDQFGWAVGISGDTAVVGARLDDSLTGSAYVFVRNGVAWSQQKKLIESSGDLFGWSVDISGDTIAVGSPGDDIGANISQGAAYIYTRSGTAWSLQLRLFASTPGHLAAFGRAVAIDGEALVVGANLEDIGGQADQGAAYVFTRSGTVWSEQAKLIAADGGRATCSEIRLP